MHPGDWKLDVKGTIARIDKRDVDKTLRNPKYFWDIVVQPDGEPTLSGAPAGAVVPPQPLFSVKEADLRGMTPALPRVGDRVEVEGVGSGPRPAQFGLRAIRIAAP